MSNFKKFSGKNMTKKPVLEGEDLELYVDESNLNAEMMDQPLRYKKYLKLKAQLARKVKSIKAKLEFTKADKRLVFTKTGARVKELDAMVVTDVEVQRLQAELYEAEEEYDTVDSICRAFYQRGDLLKELSTNLRRAMID